jgi:hypothetical protein
VVLCLSSIHEALGLIPNTGKKMVALEGDWGVIFSSHRWTGRSLRRSHLSRDLDWCW